VCVFSQFIAYCQSKIYHEAVFACARCGHSACRRRNQFLQSGPSAESSSAPCAFPCNETLAMWNSTSAQDFPEDKYDFKLQKEQRTLAETLLHVAGVDYLMMRTVSESNIGPDLGKDVINPSRDVYKTNVRVESVICREPLRLIIAL
jgi:hypothetical protein